MSAAFFDRGTTHETDEMAECIVNADVPEAGEAKRLVSLKKLETLKGLQRPNRLKRRACHLRDGCSGLSLCGSVDISSCSTDDTSGGC